MVQLKGNLIHTRGCMSGIARVGMRAPAIFSADTHKQVISIVQSFISKYGAL